MIIVAGGIDCSGKSTICEKLSKDLNASLTHFSNPKNMEDGKNQYFSFLKNTNINNTYICDRFHDGEFVYAPIYRNYIADYMDEIEKEILKNHNYLFIHTTAQLNTIIDRIKVRGEDFLKPEHYSKVMDNYINNFLMNQKMPFTIIDTTNKDSKESFKIAKKDVENLNTIWNEYKNCDICNDVLKPLSLPRGNIRGKYMIVGQNPGGKGKSTNKHVLMFSEGFTSDFFVNILKKADIYLDCWFTNLVSCSTIDNKIKDTQVNYCISKIKTQIDLIRPEKIFSLGKQTTKYLKDNFVDENIIEVEHPSYIKRFFYKDEDKITEYTNKFRR